MSISDDLSGIDYSYLNVTDADDNDEDSAVGTSLDLSDLNDEEYTVNYYIKDNAGNWKNNSWSFTVDTSYDGSSSVDFEYDDGYTFLMEDDNDDLDFNIDLGDSADEDSDIELRCYADSIDEDNQFDSDGPESVGEDGESFSCDIPGDEYADQSVDVVVEACDEAGNCEEVGQTTYNMDLTAPYIAGFQHAEELSTFNSEFDMEFDASDSATSVTQMEYFFDDATIDEGEGTEIDNFDEGEFTADPSDLESGEHTLYLRAQDEAGRWSDPEGFDFEYYPEESPEVSLTVPDRLEITAGETGEFDVTAENTGEFLIESVNLDVSSDIFSAEESISGFEPGDSLTVNFEPSASESDIGEYQVDVSTDSPSASENFTYRIVANEEQQAQVQSDLDSQTERLETLEANVSSLQQRVSDSQSERLSSNLSEYRSKVEEAQTAVDNGEYYRAQQALEGIESDFTAAQNSYQQVQEEYQASQRLKMILLVVFLILAAIGGVIGFLVYDGRIDPEEVRDEIEQRLDEIELGSEGGSSDGGSGPGIIKKIKLKLEGNDSEAEEFEWDGFRDE